VHGFVRTIERRTVLDGLVEVLTIIDCRLGWWSNASGAEIVEFNDSLCRIKYMAPLFQRKLPARVRR